MEEKTTTNTNNTRAAESYRSRSLRPGPSFLENAGLVVKCLVPDFIHSLSSEK